MRNRFFGEKKNIKNNFVFRHLLSPQYGIVYAVIIEITIFATIAIFICFSTYLLIYAFKRVYAAYIVSTKSLRISSRGENRLDYSEYTFTSLCILMAIGLLFWIIQIPIKFGFICNLTMAMLFFLYILLLLLK